MFKKIIIVITVIAALGYGAFQASKNWLTSVMPSQQELTEIQQTQASQLSYLTDNVPPSRGKILAVVTSVDMMGDNKSTGYEHTELARAYFVFAANGFEVDIASPKGGKPPVVYDSDDMGQFDYAFKNDPVLQDKMAHTIPLAKINPDEYQAVYFVGGKGTMFDFPNNVDIIRIIKALYQQDKVISAVCHGPAALLNVTLDNGEPLIKNKRVSGFTNDEELTIIPNARDIFPFLLEDKLVERGGVFESGSRYLEKVSKDGKIITGQNPWSVWALAEMVVTELGFEPKPKQRTQEEYAVELLMIYQHQGYEAALQYARAHPKAIQKLLVLMHGLVAFMTFEFSEGADLVGLVNEINYLSDT